MQLQHIELDRLSISKANMRHGKKLPDISNILPSVKKRGVLMPVLVRPNGSDETFEIVAGRRRYYAALAAAKDQDTPPPLPCAILDEDDDAAALEASLIENFVREDPDEVTKWEKFSALVKKGRSVEDIAATFGFAEAVVKRILALGNLMPRIRQAYRAEEIDAGTIRHLTLATKAQQKAWLALFADEESYAPRGHQLKAWLFGGQSISTKAALFDLEGFDGLIVKDLFEDDGYFGDADQFWTAQTAEIESRKAAYLEDGWSDVEIIPPQSYFQSWDYEKTSKRKGGRVYVDVKSSGEVTFHEGYLTRKEAERSAKGSSPEAATKAKRAEITSTMTTYIDLHRHAAVRSALASKPHVALRVMAAHAICGSPLWSVKVQDQRTRNDAVTESVENSVAEARFDERRRAVLEVLGYDADEPNIALGSEPVGGITGLFHRLLELPDAVVMEVLAVVMAETLASGTELIETLGVHLGVDMTEYWAADSVFYDLIRDREVLTAVLTDVGGASLAQAHAAEKTKTVKSVINDCLTGENGREKRENWVPRWMAFPPSAYTERGGVATVFAATRAAWLAEDDGPLNPDRQVAADAETPPQENSDAAEVSDNNEDERLAA
ncbi:ParB/RepB/Spo0J family partition protein [Parasphingorhabdus sp.]|uniref:ParB/RepB/Spo0J family partition protein n=1 Tax=Parasphingorhabdus sp. TaxID=2709688 RepID=UPI003D26C29B